MVVFVSAPIMKDLWLEINMIITNKNQIREDAKYVIMEINRHGSFIYVADGKHLKNTFRYYKSYKFLTKNDLDSECWMQR